MFRNRRSSQKPSDELYSSFKQSFPEVGPGRTFISKEPTQSSTSLIDALTDPIMSQRPFAETTDGKGQGHDVSRGANEPWRFTPSFFDTNTFAFGNYPNQPSGYYIPTPGGINTLYHSQAGDLHTPGMAMQLGTPLSMPMSESSLHVGPSLDIHGFHQQMFPANAFEPQSHYAPQASYAPSSFIHQDSGYGADGSPGNDLGIQTDAQQDLSFNTHEVPNDMPAPPLPSSEKFRYLATLNAPTAMIKQPNEIPITYLNKGQAYTISITDSVSITPGLVPIKYRTFVRVSFEDEQQRQRPAACWQLWKEGRGLAEAHQRNGRLQAVEYVDPSQQGGDAALNPSRYELELSSFDGFTVVWTPLPNSTIAECSVTVRFNFLSTDFSHSKGVKGIPVRLCTKTECISSGTPDTPPIPPSEVCFCKVKLFRDHGAERKLSNDVAHVKKTIDKLKQQITQAESGIKDFGKRKRTGSSQGKPFGERPSKVQKHKRTWSISSQNSSGRPTGDEDLHAKLSVVQDMFTSTRPVSVLYLKGAQEDDPDLFPVSLPGQARDLTKVASLSRQTSWDQKPDSDSTPTNSCLVSPTQSNRSLPSQPRSREKAPPKRPTALELTKQFSSTWTASDAFLSMSDSPFSFNRVDKSMNAVKVLKEGSDNMLPRWIEAIGVDTSYHPPEERAAKPIACFYVLITVLGKVQEDGYYRAIYLMDRTVDDLVHNISAKCNIEVTTVERVSRVNSRGLKIIIDDDVVRELPEGQDMTVDLVEVESSHIKEEATALSVTTEPSPVKRLEMRLLY